MEVGIAVVFVVTVSIVSYFFGKYDGYRLGLNDSIELVKEAIEKLVTAGTEQMREGD